MLELIETAEIRSLHDCICHRLDNEGNIACYLIVGVVQSDKGLQKPDDNDEEKGKEYDGLLHHNLEDH